MYETDRVIGLYAHKIYWGTEYELEEATLKLLLAIIMIQKGYKSLPVEAKREARYMIHEFKTLVKDAKARLAWINHTEE